MSKDGLGVEQGFQPCVDAVVAKYGFSRRGALSAHTGKCTSGAEALALTAIVNNASYRVICTRRRVIDGVLCKRDNSGLRTNRGVPSILRNSDDARKTLARCF